MKTTIAPPRRQDIASLAAHLDRCRAEAEDRERRIAACEVESSDCFLSTWACNLTTRSVEAQIELVRDGLVHTWPALYDAVTGKRLDAVVLEVRDNYDPAAGTKEVWRIGRGDDVQWHRYAHKPTARQAQNDLRKGIIQGYEWAPTWAEITGRGRGLSGTAWVAYFRFDEGWDPDATLGENEDNAKARAQRRARALVERSTP